MCVLVVGVVSAERGREQIEKELLGSWLLSKVNRPHVVHFGVDANVKCSLRSRCK